MIRCTVIQFSTDRSITPAELAVAVETRGLDGVFFPEHTHLPVTSRSPFFDGGILPEPYRRTCDPFIALAMAAAVTTRIRLGTGICLLTEHDPIVLAKTIATLDHLSGGRVVLGVGAGWNEEEMANHGTPYANFAPRWAAQAPPRTAPTTASGPAPDLPDTNARSENIQNLAEKMGQAVGQRILSEMERGQWHLKLQLRPATLGHIEVEMRMRSGEFDAVFNAPNAITRDLLQDGMSKLRETLSQMGMDVANIHVGGGQTGQSGGDPTPGFSKGKPTQAKESDQKNTTEISRAPRVKDPNDGLDVLV